VRELVTRWISAKEAIRLVALEYERSDPDAEYNYCLSKAGKALIARLKHGALKAIASKCRFGNANPFSDMQAVDVINGEVPADFWFYASTSSGWGEEWVSGDFVIKEDDFAESPIYGSAFNVHFDADHLPGLTQSPIAVSSLSPAIEMNDATVRGRPAKWDWDGAMAYLVALANYPDGLDVLAEGELRQADIERALSEWFIGKTGNAPVTSQIRARASAIMLAIAEVDKSKPDF